ncbi:hypothetical protein BJ741DRAFT_609575 [Chytriomyces cf. hyalinus JEL632]|nr:hypothetical protein BJ741DRAFT_609575 [Chytriomyces cf. hyalinus JEL632]
MNNPAKPRSTSRRASLFLVTPLGIIPEQGHAVALGDVPHMDNPRHSSRNSTVFITESEERKMSILSEESYGQPLNSKSDSQRQMIVFGKKRFNLAVLKKQASRKAGVKQTRNFSMILQSAQFDKFLLAAAGYAKAFVKLLHLEKVKMAPVVSATQEDSKMSQSNALEEKEKQSSVKQRRMSIAAHLFEDSIEASEDFAKLEKKETLQQFANAYCFLLLHVSRNGMEPAMERAYFEAIYSITKDISITLINMSPYNASIEVELNRLFRGNLFCGQPSQSQATSILAASASSTIPHEKKRRASVVVASKSLWGQGNAAATITVANPTQQLASESLYLPTIQNPAMSVNVASTNASVISNSGAPAAAMKFKAKASILGKIGALSKTSPASKMLQIATKFNHERAVLESEDVAGPSSEPASVAEPAQASPPQAPPNSVKSVEKRASVSSSSAPHPNQTVGDKTTAKNRQRKNISLSDIRMARSPLADLVLPPPQRFLFT